MNEYRLRIEATLLAEDHADASELAYILIGELFAEEGVVEVEADVDEEPVRRGVKT